MKTFALPYGKTELTITLPEEHVLYDIHGNGGATIQDVQAATREALLHHTKITLLNEYLLALYNVYA